MKNIVFGIFIFLSPILFGQTIQTLTSSGSFVVPCGVTSITVQCWGGGGAGGGATGNPSGGGGGAGGAYSYSVIGVTSGATINYTVGNGGNGGTGNGPSGENTSFGGVVAVGGAGGSRSNTNNVSVAGAIASSAGSVGSTITTGGNGGGNILGAGANAGGGGGGGGTTANGGNGGTTTAGTGGVSGGGNGGSGGSTGGNGNDGNNGSAPGGGGGGGRAGSNTDRDGGNGARGQIVISYSGEVVANANSNQSLNLCTTNTVALNGNTITATTGSWTCVSGCAGLTITTPTLATTSVTGFTATGNVVLRWTLTSASFSCSSNDDMQITVSKTTGFTANAGSDQTNVSCTTTTASVTGNTVTGTSGSWSCVSGCGGVSITNPTMATTTITGLTINRATTLRWTLTSNTNTTCISTDNMIIVINCAATNDNPCSATPVTVNSAAICSLTTSGTVFGATTSTVTDDCNGNPDDDVWFTFVANNTSQEISLLNIVGNSTNLNHAVYDAPSCGTLTNSTIDCSDPNNSTVTGLTVGNTYYVRVYTSTSTSGRNTVFDICIKPPPPPPTNTTCAVQSPICSDTPITFQAQGGSGTAEPGPNYGCLDEQPRPTWFYLEIATSGDMAIDITANADVDFALWGPYPTLAAAQSSCTSYPSPIDCSYSTSSIEQANVNGAIAGEVYVLLVTNYNGSIQTINLTNSGASTAATNCSIVPNPLPIELISFEATINDNKNIVLNWTTATETNNDYFEIQRSDNAYNWVTIGMQKGAGNSSVLKNYQYIDKEPLKTISYYRLKQVDFDKTFTYSKMISVDLASLPETISNLHPNPAKDLINFDWKASKKSNITIELLDSKGEIKLHETKMAEEGFNNLTIDLSEFKNGIYMLKVSSETSGKSSIYKLLKL